MVAISFFDKFRLAGLFFLLVLSVNSVSAQKILSEQETRWVQEATTYLQRAISDPAIDAVERVRLVEKSTRTLKEYGQPADFPKGTIPLKMMMESNYNQSRREFEDANELYKLLSTKLLDQQLKIVNTLQIEVAEEQIKIMLPGLPAPYELSKDLVATFFKWDIAEGFNQGTYGDAKSLATRFRKLAETKELIKVLEDLRISQQRSMQNLHRDLQMVGPLEAQLRKKFELATASTRTLQGYEGARLNSGNSDASKSTAKQETTSLKSVEGNINIIDIRVSGNSLLEYSSDRIYDGDRNVGLSADYNIGFFILNSEGLFDGHYAREASFSGTGAYLQGGNLNFTSTWQAKGVLHSECCMFDAKVMHQVQGKYSNGVITELKLKETSIRDDYEGEETVQIIYNQEKYVELINIPIKKYPAELNKKYNTNYLYYAEITGDEVESKVKVLRDRVDIRSRNPNFPNSVSELKSVKWGNIYGNYKLEIFLGQFKNYKRDW